MTSSEQRGLSFAEKLAAAGVSELDIRRIKRFCRWDRERISAEFRSEGWERRILAHAIAAENLKIAEETTAAVLAGLSESGPKSVAAFTVEELIAKCSAPKLRELAMNWNPFAHGGRLVCGPTGRGKTLAAVAVVRRFFSEPYVRERLWTEAMVRTEPGWYKRPGWRWVRAFDLVNARLQTGLGKGEADLVRDAVRADFLVLDDLGWESQRANNEDVVVEVIAKRYDAGKPTYVSTGQKLDDLIARYGDAFVRRVQDAGGRSGKVINLW